MDRRNRVLLALAVAVFAFTFGYLAHRPGPAFLQAPPTRIYVSRPNGADRVIDRLEVLRVAPNDDPSPIPADAWRVILMTAHGTRFAECRNTGMGP